MSPLTFFLVAAQYSTMQISYNLSTQYLIIGNLDCFLFLFLAITFKRYDEHPIRYIFVSVHDDFLRTDGQQWNS